MIKHEQQRRDDQNGARERERLHERVLELAPVVVRGGHFAEMKNVELRMKKKARKRIECPRFFILHSSFFICFSVAA
jgi:hydroxymethylpyrimidine/phosphomethylpyrimidine kinase